jgi:hypothetical protein
VAYAYRQRLTYVYIGSGSKNWGDQKGTSGLPVTPRMPSRIFEGRRFSISKRPEVGQFDSTADIRCGRFGGRFASGFLPSRARPEMECQSASPKSLNPVLWWRPFKGAEQGILSRPDKAQSYPGDSSPKSIECLTVNYELQAPLNLYRIRAKNHGLRAAEFEPDVAWTKVVSNRAN